MRRIRWITSGVTAMGALACAAVAACAPQHTCEDYNACAPAGGGSSLAGGAAGAGGGGAGTTGTGGTPGAGGLNGGAGAAPDCPADASPAEETCVVAAEHGVFVSAGADDAIADGTRERPYASLGAAVEAAIESGKHVYACATAGTYTQPLTIPASAEGLRVYGGFDCDGWAYSTELKARIEAAGDPATLVVDGATGVVLSDFEVQAPDAASPGGSSIALFARNASGLTLERVALAAGAGADGDAGALTEYSFPDAETLRGGDGTNLSLGIGCPRDGVPVECPAGDTAGNGGDGGIRYASGAPGGAGQPDGTNGGSVAACDASTTGGGPGAVPETSADGLGAQRSGALMATGWVPDGGVSGEPGSAGQGGGGGASVDLSGFGGGGGCGGCGGAAARAGAGGGASIALAAYESSVTLIGCSLQSSRAGNGGAALGGQPGQRGGVGGSGYSPACQGGRGGAGQDGGAAGGGAGGVSVGVLFSGTEPVVDAETAITPGSAGDGGLPLAGKPLTAGIDGTAEAVLPSP